MIILDTNAVSEVMKPAPSETVLRWLASQESQHIFVTVITQAEMLYGVEVSAPGKRKLSLLTRTEKLFGAEDAMIAAIARAYGAAVATRNTGDFEHGGIRLIDPWSAADVH